MSASFVPQGKPKTTCDITTDSAKGKTITVSLMKINLNKMLLSSYLFSKELELNVT